jgi:hypothetical protein
VGLGGGSVTPIFFFNFFKIFSFPLSQLTVNKQEDQFGPLSKPYELPVIKKIKPYKDKIKK